MNNNHLSVLHCCQYAAPYEGNFLKSLCTLEETLYGKGCAMGFVFPNQAMYQPWWKEFKAKHIVFTTTDRVEKSVSELSVIIQQFDPAIIHTHFDGYDIPVLKATKNLHLPTQVIFHLHNAISFHPNIAKAVYQVFFFLRHYYWFSKGVSIIGVNSEVINFCKLFRGFLGGDFLHSKMIPNGISLERIISPVSYKPHKKLSFLAFGGRNSDKRIDLILSAANLLVKDYAFEIYITIGTDTKEVVDNFFKGNVPSWCILLEQSDDINSVFAHADCFISSSVHETFSYGICEATVYGLPVIQSDIEGTRWNAENPSTLIFQSENVDDLARAMQEFLVCDKDKMAVSVIKTQERNRAEYNVERWSEKVYDFYLEVLHNKPQ